MARPVALSLVVLAAAACSSGRPSASSAADASVARNDESGMDAGLPAVDAAVVREDVFAPEACDAVAPSEDCRHARQFVERQRGNSSVVVFKAKRLLYLFHDGRPVVRQINLKDYDPAVDKPVERTLRFPVPIALSKTSTRPPEEYGTPEGEYTLCSSIGPSKYTHFFGISYPGPKDVARALQQKWRKPEQLERIRRSQRPGRCPDFYTGLGGDFGIHGAPISLARFCAAREMLDPDFRFVTTDDWTLGCVAVENRVIHFLAKELRVGTPILVVP